MLFFRNYGGMVGIAAFKYTSEQCLQQTFLYYFCFEYVVCEFHNSISSAIMQTLCGVIFKCQHNSLTYN